MARAVVARRPLVGVGEGFLALVGLPQLSEESRKVYDEVLPERFKQFSQPSKHQDAFYYGYATDIEARNHKQPPSSHELRHDAESAFWLLVWWAVHIRPNDGPNDPNDPEASKIPFSRWLSLTSVDIDTKDDSRECFLYGLLDGHRWLDPVYEGLDLLFRQMAIQIRGDLYWVHKGLN
jgi:hypothetical protein